MNQKGLAPIIVLLLVVVAGGVLIGAYKTKNSSYSSTEITPSITPLPESSILPSSVPSLIPKTKIYASPTPASSAKSTSAPSSSPSPVASSTSTPSPVPAATSAPASSPTPTPTSMPTSSPTPLPVQAAIIEFNPHQAYNNEVVTIFGSNLGNSGSVTFEGKFSGNPAGDFSAEVVSWESYRIKVKVPTGNYQTARLKVQTSSGQTLTLTDDTLNNFTFVHSGY